MSRVRAVMEAKPKKAKFEAPKFCLFRKEDPISLNDFRG